jgi:hypothetical protein
VFTASAPVNGAVEDLVKVTGDVSVAAVVIGVKSAFARNIKPADQNSPWRAARRHLRSISDFILMVSGQNLQRSEIPRSPLKAQPKLQQALCH